MAQDADSYHKLPELAGKLGMDVSNEVFTQMASCIFERIGLGILVTDAKGIIVGVNPAFTILTGYSAGEAIGQNPSFLKSGRQSPEFYSQLWASLNTSGHWQGVVWNRRKSGEHFAELLSISSICAPDGSITHYLGTFSDITQIKEHEMRLEYLAHYDSLTQLPNRILLKDRLLQAMARCRRHQQYLAICVLDLDKFKPVNDQFGHVVGDELLILAAQRMDACLRDSDTLARIGGDEFVVLLCDLPSPDAGHETLGRLLQLLQSPFELGRQHLQIGVSIGVTLYPEDLCHADTLIHHADQAMYEAKHAGGNCYRVYRPDVGSL